MTGRELLASVCDDAIRVFELRLEDRAHAEIYATEEFARNAAAAVESTA